MLHSFAKRLRELHEKKRDERGFTLIELLVVNDSGVDPKIEVPDTGHIGGCAGDQPTGNHPGLQGSVQVR